MGNLLCFRKFLVSKIFIDRKEGGRECHNFPSKICCLTVPKDFVGEPFCISEKSWYRKILWIRGVEGVDVTIRNRKKNWHDRDSNPGPTSSEPCFPNPTAVIYFWIKRIGNFGLTKKRKTTPLNEWFFLHTAYAAKNKKKYLAARNHNRGTMKTVSSRPYHASVRQFNFSCMMLPQSNENVSGALDRALCWIDLDRFNWNHKHSDKIWLC